MILKTLNINFNKIYVSTFVLLVLLLINTVSLQYIFGREYISLIKAFFLLGILVCYLDCRYIRKDFLVHWVLFLLFLISCFNYLNDTVNSFISFLGLLLPWLFLNVKLKQKEAVLYIIALSSLLSLLFGVVLWATGYWSVVRLEYTGAMRLQGASVPAHFAFLCFTGLLATTVLLFKKCRWGGFLYLLNISLLALSGTRMGIVLALLLSLYLFYKGIFRVKKSNFLYYFLFLIAFFFIMYEYLPSLYQRTFGEGYNFNSDFGFNSSGRFEAWALYIDLVKDNNTLFGNGLGTIVYPFEKGLTHFGVPHNEYIRFYYETGILGVSIFFSAISYIHIRLISCHKNRQIAFFFLILLLIYSSTDNVLSTLQFTMPYALILSILKDND